VPAGDETDDVHGFDAMLPGVSRTLTLLSRQRASRRTVRIRWWSDENPVCPH
jgi:hypothetical protein